MSSFWFMRLGSDVNATHTDAYVRIHIRTCTQTHARTRTRTFTHAHTHAHTHTHQRPSEERRKKARESLLRVIRTPQRRLGSIGACSRRLELGLLGMITVSHILERERGIRILGLDQGVTGVGGAVDEVVGYTMFEFHIASPHNVLFIRAINSP